MEPSEAMIEAGAEALWNQDPHRIRWAELREATKTMARIQARECLRAAMVGVEVVYTAGDRDRTLEHAAKDTTMALRKGDTLAVFRGGE